MSTRTAQHAQTAALRELCARGFTVARMPIDGNDAPHLRLLGCEHWYLYENAEPLALLELAVRNNAWGDGTLEPGLVDLRAEAVRAQPDHFAENLAAVEWIYEQTGDRVRARTADELADELLRFAEVQSLANLFDEDEPELHVRSRDRQRRKRR